LLRRLLMSGRRSRSSSVVFGKRLFVYYGCVIEMAH
jgi:hypothetical protein